MTMPTMNIKDPEVHAAAQRLAAIRHISLTAAVRQAIDEALGKHRSDRDDFVERILEIGRRTKTMSDEPFLTDDDLYDEWGLPR